MEKKQTLLCLDIQAQGSFTEIVHTSINTAVQHKLFKLRVSCFDAISFIWETCNWFILVLSSSFIDPRVGRITNDLTPLVSVFHDPYQLRHWSSSPVLDGVHPSSFRSATSSRTGCCALDNVFFQASWFFPRNMSIVYQFSLFHRCQYRHLSVPAVNNPFIRPFRCPWHPQDQSQTLHLKSVDTCFICLLQCPTLATVKNHWPHQCFQESNFGVRGYAVVLPDLFKSNCSTEYIHWL